MEGFPHNIFQFVLPSYIRCPFDIVACSQVSREWRKTLGNLPLRWKTVWKFLNGAEDYDIPTDIRFVLFPFDIGDIELVFSGKRDQRIVSTFLHPYEAIPSPYEQLNICACLPDQMCYRGVDCRWRGELEYESPSCKTLPICNGPLPIGTLKWRICILAGCRCWHPRGVEKSSWNVRIHVEEGRTTVARQTACEDIQKRHKTIN